MTPGEEQRLQAEKIDEMWMPPPAGEGVSPAQQISLLEQIFPELAEKIAQMRADWIKEFHHVTAPEMMILDQAMVSYAYGLILAQEAVAFRRPLSPAGDAKEEAQQAKPPGRKDFYRQLCLLARFQKAFLRNAGAMKNWRSQDPYVASLDSATKLMRG